MRIYIFMVLCGLLTTFTPGKASAESTNYRQITDIGCTLSSSICYVGISGDAAGPTACRSTSIRWNAKNDENGKNILSLLTAAYLSGKKVSFYIRNGSCFADQPVYPTFDYINIQ